MWKKITVKTESGSTYVVDRRGDSYYLYAKHNPTVTSRNVNGKEWEVAQPMPPVIGMPWLVMSAHFFDKSDSRRMPGGGKYTSNVVDFQIEN